MDGRIFALLAATVLLSVACYRLRHRLNVLPALREPQLPQPASEADRLARLLVTEIKLYNLQEVEAVARGHSDPSPELCAEIAASQATYRERIPAHEQAEYFETAVLKILAFGRKSVYTKLLS